MVGMAKALFLEMMKSLGEHSESDEFDIWRKKKSRGSVIFLRGQDVCSAANRKRKLNSSLSLELRALS